jgi:hypothetical protein
MSLTGFLVVQAGASPVAVGIGLGALIAIVSGFSLALMLLDWHRSRTGWNRLVGGLTLVRFPLFWFGGPWLTHLMGWLDWPAVLPWYVATLTAGFTAIALFPLYKLIVRCGNLDGDDRER